MFDTFGFFESSEELNEAAAGLKAEGDTKNIYLLAKENGIDQEDASDYIAGELDKLSTTLTAAMGRLEIESNADKNNVAVQIIILQIKSMLHDKEVAAAVMKKDKSANGIYDKLRSEAEKAKVGNVGVACGTDADLKKIIRIYYLGK